MAKTFKTMDGNTAAAHVSYAFTDVAAIFPITPSSPMAEHSDEWAAQGKKNLFGQTVALSELQSEAGAAGAVHGSLSAGALTTTYTASQGLLLMIPNMYKIAGELLPGVFHVTARALAGHALSIFGDHSDVMACRQTGFAMLATSSVQEVMDLGGIAHLAAIKTRVPFMHFFDGFRTSHEYQKIEVMDYEDLNRLLDHDAVAAFRSRALSPNHPHLRGSAQNPDIFFQAKEAANSFYETVPDVVNDYMKEINKITGRDYKPFNYYGHPEAERIIVIMGSGADVTAEAIDYLVAKGEKVGMINIHLYRPFSPKYFFDVLPSTVKRIAVMDRCKEPGALGEPLYTEIKTLFYGNAQNPVIVGGRYGLGSKDTTPAQIVAVFENLKAGEPKNHFTIGIVDDVTMTSLTIGEEIDTAAPGTKNCKFWGLGSDGTVGANKQAVAIIGDNTDLYAQAYFAYDSKKSGGVTMSHLRFGKERIRSPYLINNSDYIACHTPSYIHSYGATLLNGIKDGGKFVLNSIWTEEQLNNELPAEMKRILAKKNVKFYIINAVDIASKLGLGNRINMVMQTAFFKLANIIPIEDAVGYLKAGIKKTYGRKGDAIVKMNCDAVDAALNSLVEVKVPAEWANATDAPKGSVNVPEFITKIMQPMNKQEGDKLPVSTFVGKEDGTFPMGTSQYEKRGIATNVPEWQTDACIQCNQCSMVCPHAAIRPVLVDATEKANAPEGFVTKKAIGKGLENLEYRMQLSPMDCSGCGVCSKVCPSKTPGLEMKPLETQMAEEKNWEYAKKVTIKDNLLDKKTIKGSQFCQPLFEFSGACAGCGETPYIKLVTQLFGDRMMIANATGCTSIYGGSAPSVPYTVNAKGHGPAWANSLFEDNAEYGMGMMMATKQMRKRIADLMDQALISSDVTDEVKTAFKAWLENMENGTETRAVSEEVERVIEPHTGHKLIGEIAKLKDFLVKRSQWVFGGDGWAYDIGYGGLDHVLASGEDINILVVDTEVYSNTGGQSSKSTPAAAIAQFAASGKKTKKKDLGMMAMSYGYVYVAQVAMGADKNQLLKAMAEAEAYHGPSLIICYAPCINHGLKGGMGNSQIQEKKAVEAGYWHLYRFNPTLNEEGKNPFTLDSKEPTANFREFITSEVRYSSLEKAFPQQAPALFEKAEKDAKDRLDSYKRMAAMEFANK